MAELLVCLAIFAGILVVAGLAVSRCAWILRHASGRDYALGELARARKVLLTDLELSRASAATFQRTQVPASQGAGYDGDAVNFLSPLAPDLSEAAYDTDGTVRWMRNLTYYLVVPQDHGGPCAGVADAQGYDDGCPHKILVRQVTHQNGADPEVLLTSFTSFPRLPTATATVDRKTVATKLLTFRCQRVSGGEIEVILRAVSLADAQREVKLGSVPLTGTRFVLEQRLRVFPKN